MLQFKQIKQRTSKQLSQLFPKLIIKSNILKSSSLKSLYKIIQCQKISTRDFKECIEQMGQIQENNKQQNVLHIHEVLKRTEQYFTACINILEHNQKIRQRYEVILLNQQKYKDLQLKEIKQLIRMGHSIRSKNEFMSFLQANVSKIFNQQQKSPVKSSLSYLKSLSQIKQVYLPNNPDQYSFVTKIQQDQYLVYHQQIVQKLLIYVNSINKINRELFQFLGKGKNNTVSTQNNSSSDQSMIKVHEIMNQLAVDELFRVQDNKFNQLLNYILNYVKLNWTMLQKKKNSSLRYKSQLKQSCLRLYYMVFMSRNQLEIVKTHLNHTINQNQRIINAHLNNYNNQLQHSKIIDHSEFRKQLDNFNSLREKVKQILDYLCDKEEDVFDKFYDRKIKKIILCSNDVMDTISTAIKLNKSLIERCEQNDQNESQSLEILNFLKKQFLLTNKNQQKQTQSSKLLNLQNETQALTISIKALQQNILAFIQSLLQSKNSIQSNISQFNKYFQQLQNIQLKFSELKYKQTQLKTYSQQSSQLNQNLKHHILQIQMLLIEKIKIKINTKQARNFQSINKVINNSNIVIEDDKMSIRSGVSSKFSIFQQNSLNENQIFLTKPQIDQNYLPHLSFQELVNSSNQFILKDFLNNQRLYTQLEDFKNIDLKKLQNLIFQLNNSSSLLQLNIHPLQSQVKPQTNKIQDKSKTPQKRKGSKSKPSKKQNSDKKSSKKQNQASKIHELNEHNKKKQIVFSLKTKLNFIKFILLPQISQSKVKILFNENNNNIHIEILDKMINILLQYKNKLWTQNCFAEAQKLGFRRFVSGRAQIVIAILDNSKEFLELLKSIRGFFQSKPKLEAIQDNSFNLILKALLADKELQANRNQNFDLAKVGKIPVCAVQFLEDQLYIPFIKVFKSVLKVISNSQSLRHQLEEIMQNIEKCIHLKQELKDLILSETQNIISSNSQQLISKIKNIIQRCNDLRLYQFLRYNKLQQIAKRLKYSISLQPKNKTEDKRKLMLNYLNLELIQVQKGKSQSLLN